MATYVSTDGAKEVTLQDLYNLLALLLDRLEFGLITDSMKHQKVNVETGAVAVSGSLTTVTNVTNAGTLTDQNRVGGMLAYRQVEALMDAAFNAGILANVSF
jgi:hypothetical protein